MEQTIFVWAGSWKQFKEFIRTRRDDTLRYEYIGSLDQLRGIRGATILLYGTADDRKGYADLLTISIEQNLEVLESTKWNQNLEK